jgi:hypothetical protein
MTMTMAMTMTISKLGEPLMRVEVCSLAMRGFCCGRSIVCHDAIGGMARFKTEKQGIGH